MPDVHEVFRMATQKVRPDPGAMDRQSRTQQRRSTRQRLGGYALLAILVIAAAVISVLALRPREQQPADQPEREAPSAAQIAVNPYFLDLDTGQARLLPENIRGGLAYVASPDGTRLVYEEGDGCSETQLTVANIDGTGVRTIEAPEGFVICGARWSPDGTRLVYQGRPATNDDVGNLLVHDLATGEAKQITHLELSRAWWYYLAPSFSQHGGDEVVFHMPRSSSPTTRWDVWGVPVTGGEPQLLLRDASWPMTNPSPPGSDQYAFQFLQPSANDLVGQSIMTGHPCCGASRQTLVEANEGIWWPTMSPDGNRIAYQDGGSIYVLEIVTGESSVVAAGNTAEWLDSDTLIVAP